jgi:predicted RNA methylase
MDYLYDLNYGTDTITQRELDYLTIESENKERGVRYQPTRVMLLRKLFEKIRPIIPADPVLVDFGCGKGRVLLVASEFGFKEARGIEFSPELCKIARDNCAIYRKRTGTSTDFQIIEADVTNYRINSNENIFFMFKGNDLTL